MKKTTAVKIRSVDDEVFPSPEYESEDWVDSSPLYCDDVTGVLGLWLELDTSDIPTEAIKHLQQAYTICAKALEGGD